MKRNWIWIVILLILLGLYGLELGFNHVLLKDFKELEAENREILYEARNVRSDLKKTERELNEKRAEYDKLEASYEDLFEEHLQILDYHLIPSAENTGVYYADGIIQVRGLPLDKAALTGYLDHALVTAYVTVWGENDVLWSLVNVPNLGDNVDTVGWVKWEELREYTAQDAETLEYPVRVKAGVELYDEQRNRRVTADGEVSYTIGRRPSESEIVLFDSGGIEYTVAREDLIYPTVQDGEIVWD